METFSYSLYAERGGGVEGGSRILGKHSKDISKIFADGHDKILATF